MPRLVVDSNNVVEINSSIAPKVQYDLSVEQDASLVFKISGKFPLQIDVDLVVKQDKKFSLLFINENNETLTINDTYALNQNAQVNIAYSQLNNYSITTNSNYKLLEPMANLHVLSASISSNNNKFNQNTQHFADFTTAHIDNYGIVLKDGKCEMVVKNTINKGFHNCSTHQTSRLLTYDKTAIGKILPILIIDDNEVAASHACSLGQPDENQLYYLQTRGLTYREALRLITIGYLMPITKIVEDSEINNLLKTEIESKVAAYV